jgi:thymidylate synthase (FAD)
VKIVNPSVELVTSTPEPERLIERMGRICYQSSHKVKLCPLCKGTGNNPCCACNGTGTDIESAIAFVNMIKTNQHESVLEHPSASFMVVCDRGVTHEKVRHRIASFSQESTRYCNYMKEIFGNEISVIQPPFAYPEKSIEDFVEACEFSEKKYLKLLANGESPQIARSVLPTCLKATNKP